MEKLILARINDIQFTFKKIKTKKNLNTNQGILMAFKPNIRYTQMIIYL